MLAKLGQTMSLKTWVRRLSSTDPKPQAVTRRSGASIASVSVRKQRPAMWSKWAVADQGVLDVDLLGGGQRSADRAGVYEDTIVHEQG